jgi:putative ABC transport system ATP-binding protein
MNVPAMELRGVGKTYAGGVEVLQGIDLTIEQGELLAIVGPSGSGKSTLLHIMGTLDRPTVGRVVVAGQDADGRSDDELAALRAHALGFVFQQFFLLDGMSALDNVAGGLLYRGLSRAERRRRAAAQLERVGLGHRLDHVPAKLSGGERQRVAIARALVGAPAVVLADEPTGNLDTASGAGVEALLHELGDEGATIVLITHDRDVAGRMPRRVELIDGRIVADERAEHSRRALGSGRELAQGLVRAVGEDR